MATSERERAGKSLGGEKLAATLPSVSSRTGKVNPLSLAHAAVFSLLSRTSMMRTWTFLSLYAFQSASRCGASALQNGHQLVAKWMTTNLPRRSARATFSPCVVSRLNAGAASPILGCGSSSVKPVAGTANKNSRSKRTACLNEKILSIFILLTGSFLKDKGKRRELQL